MTPFERIEELEKSLKLLWECPGNFVLLEQIIKDVRELKEQELLLKEIF